MIHRPQFCFQTFDGCQDVDFVYYFDGSNVPNLNQDISGLTIRDIPLTLDQDAPFYWRAVKFNADRRLTGGTTPTAYIAPDVALILKDAYYNDLMNDFVPATLWGYPSNPVAVNSANLTGPPVPLSHEIYCPPGGTIWLSVQAAALSGSQDHFVSLSLHGVKRYRECAQ